MKAIRFISGSAVFFAASVGILLSVSFLMSPEVRSGLIGSFRGFIEKFGTNRTDRGTCVICIWCNKCNYY